MHAKVEISSSLILTATEPALIEPASIPKKTSEHLFITVRFVQPVTVDDDNPLKQLSELISKK